MPVNYMHIQNELPAYAQKMKQHQTELEGFEQTLWDQFSTCERSLADMRVKISLAEQRIKNLYCAKPVSEALLTCKAVPELPSPDYILIAADGSQIAPNRHEALQFSVINVGLIKTRFGSGKVPEINILSHLLDFDQLISETGRLIGEDDVALQRDLAERQYLLEFAPAEDVPTITLTDGPLNLYQSPKAGEKHKEMQSKLNKIHAHLEARQIISGGYIDKPGSDMIGRMLYILALREDQLAKYDDKQRDTRGITDARLLGRLLMEGGQRSAIFEAVSKREDSSPLPVHFFYLNVSLGEKPYLVRVEFPAWVSAQPEMVDLLHAAIFREVRVLDTHPYPYALQRAHELAIINMSEHEYVQNMLQQEFDQESISLGMRSNKEANKSLLRK